MDGHIETEHSTVAEAEHERCVDLELTHQLDRVLGHVVVVKLAVRGVRGAAMTHLLRRNHPESVREERNLCRIDRAGTTVQQQQWRALPMSLVVHAEPIDIGVAAIVRHARSMTAAGDNANGWRTPRRRYFRNPLPFVMDGDPRRFAARVQQRRRPFHGMRVTPSAPPRRCRTLRLVDLTSARQRPCRQRGGRAGPLICSRNAHGLRDTTGYSRQVRIKISSAKALVSDVLIAIGAATADVEASVHLTDGAAVCQQATALSCAAVALTRWKVAAPEGKLTWRMVCDP